MAKRTEDIELDDINRVDDVIREGEDESSFTDDNRPGDESMIIIDTSIPNVRRDAGVMRRAFTKDKKDFLREKLGVRINKRDAEKRFDNMSLTVDGAKYKRVTVLDTQGVYNSEPSAQRAVNEFKGLIEKAKAKYSNSAIGYVEKEVAEDLSEDIQDDLASNVLDNTLDRIQDELSEKEDKIVAGLNVNELRAFRGILRRSFWI